MWGIREEVWALEPEESLLKGPVCASFHFYVTGKEATLFLSHRVTLRVTEHSRRQTELWTAKYHENHS